MAIVVTLAMGHLLVSSLVPVVIPPLASISSINWWRWPSSWRSHDSHATWMNTTTYSTKGYTNMYMYMLQQWTRTVKYSAKAHLNSKHTDTQTQMYNYPHVHYMYIHVRACSSMNRLLNRHCSVYTTLTIFTTFCSHDNSSQSIGIQVTSP